MYLYGYVSLLAFECDMCLCVYQIRVPAKETHYASGFSNLDALW